MATVFLICWSGAQDYATLGARNETQMVQINLTPLHSYLKVWNCDNVEFYQSNFMKNMLFYPAGLLGASLFLQWWLGWCRCILGVLFL